ncbi:hypothetical protein GCM10022287_02670 [Gryllotalpicola koreensis]|uniref:Uncharacterized protein n=1 Tax=Gryllotalpicola koreensis TaxID=993086 RepID=A0ABP7ZR63_9MICO
MSDSAARDGPALAVRLGRAQVEVFAGKKRAIAKAPNGREDRGDRGDRGDRDKLAGRKPANCRRGYAESRGSLMTSGTGTYICRRRAASPAIPIASSSAT